jgi:uncharacterized protein YabE (DUF348 family)
LFGFSGNKFIKLNLHVFSLFTAINELLYMQIFKRSTTQPNVEAGAVEVKGWHRHPFAVPVITIFALLFVSAAIFLVGGGETIGAADSKVVQLSLDGQKRVVPTRAETVGDLLNRLQVTIQKEDIVEPALDSPIIGDKFSINVHRARPVTVIDDSGRKIVTKIADSDPTSIAKKAGITVYPEDRVAVATPEDTLKDGVVGEKITVDRATPANINLYGNSIPTRTHAQTVGDALKEKGIKTLEGDTVQPSLDTPITDDTQIFVIRLGKQIETKEEEIAAPVETTNDPNASTGTTVVQEPGAPGKKVVTYEIELRNGKEASRRTIQEVVSVQPQKRVVAKGSKIIINNPSENVKLGEQLAAARGWTGGEWYCLYQLWQSESGWRTTAGNPSSGAYGIPQALPGSKMGAGWQSDPNVQINWGLGYIARTYGTPCGAWQKFNSRVPHWY